MSMMDFSAYMSEGSDSDNDDPAKEQATTSSAPGATAGGGQTGALQGPARPLPSSAVDGNEGEDEEASRAKLIADLKAKKSKAVEEEDYDQGVQTLLASACLLPHLCFLTLVCWLLSCFPHQPNG